MARPILLSAGLFLATTCIVPSAMAAPQQDPTAFALTPDSVFATVNDFGGGGLMQTPTARFGRDGQFYGGASTVWPYRRYFVTVNVMPWLEGTLRYTDIRNRLYSLVPEFSGDQSYKDRGVDLRIRLLEEGIWSPALAVGMRDIGGTGLFGSEFIVANKAVGDFDFSFGFGWGYVGGRGVISNPLNVISDRFRDREVGGEYLGGTLNTDIFSGDLGLFGGVAWQTPVEGLLLQLEYDGNDYKTDPLDNRLDVDSPINVAAVYKHSDWLQLSAGVERGNRAMFRLVATTNVNDESRVPKIDPPAPVVPVRDPADLPVSSTEPYPSQGDATGVGDLAARVAMMGLHLSQAVRTADGMVITAKGTPAQDPVSVAYDIARNAALLDPTFDGNIRVRLESAWVPLLDMEFAAGQVRGAASAATDRAPEAAIVDPGLDKAELDDLKKGLSDQGATLLAADLQAPRISLYVAQGRYRRIPQAIGRISRAAAATLPPRYEEIRIVLVDGDVEVLSATLYRRDLEAAFVPGQGSLDELWLRTRLEAPTFDMDAASQQIEEAQQYPSFAWSLRPALRQTLGRPEQFILYQFWARLNGWVNLAPGVTAKGSLGFDIANNFDKLQVESDSVLPRVRSDIKEYLAEGTTALTELNLNYTFAIAPEVYGHVYGGLMEEMFGGVGGEVLYVPFGKDWAVGLDLNWVQQRDYDQWFDFQDYDVVTGHVTAYYHYSPLDMDMSVKAGRYLAGDIGTTFQVSRTFDSGIAVGAFASFTDVSAEEFGEGRFDKGIYFYIPLDQLYVKYVRSAIAWAWRPTIRDGGQILNIPQPLIGTVSAGRINTFQGDWRRVGD